VGIRGLMSHPFLHPGGKILLERVSQLFRSDEAYILRDSNILFVCGGPMVCSNNTSLPSMRSRFFAYAKTELMNLRMFLAEDAEKDYVTHDDPEFHNVAKFEEIIGDVCDCLVIFPESPGSFAEIGYFAKNKRLTKKILVAHKADLQGEDSFILRGPIQIIDSDSHFAPTLQIDYGDHANFLPIKQRIEKRITGKKRKKFEFVNYSSMTTRQRFFCIFEILRFFQVMTFIQIKYAFKSIFEHARQSDIKNLLSILVAADLVRRRGRDHQYFCINRHAKAFMEFDEFDDALFRLEVIDFYNRHFDDVAAMVKKLSDDH
jgi:hypothetical protein